MSRPIPGKLYTVVSGDSLSSIAASAYGDDTKWPAIYKANQTNLKSSSPDLIYPGEIILIPVLPELKSLLDALSPTQDRDPNTIYIEIEGYNIPIQAASIIRTMDTAGDGWSCSLAWVPGADPILDKITAPYSYSNAKAFIGNEKLVDGRLYIVGHSLTNDGQRKELLGFSFTIDVVDSDLKPPYEKEKVTLLQRVKDTVSPYGIAVIVDDGVDIGGRFDRVTASPQEKIFDHLASLAQQRSLLLSSTVNGDFLITKAKTTGVPVGDIEESSAGEEEFTANFDGRKRFNVYKVITQSADKTSEISAIAKDNKVKGSRFKTFSVQDVTKGEVKRIAEWERSRALADALTIPFPVTSWYAPNGKLWRENTLVSVTSSTIGAPNGFIFLIRSVKFIFEAGGSTAILSLVPPQVYTGEELEEPWL